MSFKDVKAGVRNSGNLIKEAEHLMNTNAFAGMNQSMTRADAQAELAARTGAEGFNNFTAGFKTASENGSLTAALASFGRTNHEQVMAPMLTEKLMAAGFSKQDLAGFWGGNALRALKQAEAMRAK